MMKVLYLSANPLQRPTGGWFDCEYTPRLSEFQIRTLLQEIAEEKTAELMRQFSLIARQIRFSQNTMWGLSNLRFPVVRDEVLLDVYRTIVSQGLNLADPLYDLVCQFVNDLVAEFKKQLQHLVAKLILIALRVTLRRSLRVKSTFTPVLIIPHSIHPIDAAA